MNLNPQGVALLVLGGVATSYSIPIGLTFAGHGPRFMRGLGFLAGPMATIYAWALAIAVAIAYVYFTILNVPGIRESIVTLSWLKAVAIIAAICAGIFEEALFRRFIMDGIKRANANAWVQAAVSGLAFGLAHGVWGLFGGGFQVALGAVVATTMLGCALAVVYLVGNRSLAPCIVAHGLIDVLIEPGLILSALSGSGMHTVT